MRCSGQTWVDKRKQERLRGGPTCPALRAGTGTSASCSTSVPPHSEICTAFMAASQKAEERRDEVITTMSKSRVRLLEDSPRCRRLPATIACHPLRIALGSRTANAQCDRLKCSGGRRSAVESKRPTRQPPYL